MPWLQILRALQWQECDFFFFPHCGGYLIYVELTQTASQVGETVCAKVQKQDRAWCVQGTRIWFLELEQKVGGKQGQDCRA